MISVRIWDPAFPKKNEILSGLAPGLTSKFPSGSFPGLLGSASGTNTNASNFRNYSPKLEIFFKLLPGEALKPQLWMNRVSRLNSEKELCETRTADCDHKQTGEGRKLYQQMYKSESFSSSRIRASLSSNSSILVTTMVFKKSFAALLLALPLALGMNPILRKCWCAEHDCSFSKSNTRRMYRLKARRNWFAWQSLWQRVWWYGQYFVSLSWAFI